MTTIILLLLLVLGAIACPGQDLEPALQINDELNHQTDPQVYARHYAPAPKRPVMEPVIVNVYSDDNTLIAINGGEEININNGNSGLTTTVTSTATATKKASLTRSISMTAGAGTTLSTQRHSTY
jgi:hypothetical protein